MFSHQEKCTLTFTGNAAAGQYFIYLMVEDWIRAFNGRPDLSSTPLSAVPLHLSVTGESTGEKLQFVSFLGFIQVVLLYFNPSVEESGVNCDEEPVIAQDTPAGDTRLTVLPFHQETFNVDFISRVERFVGFLLGFSLFLFLAISILGC